MLTFFGDRPGGEILMRPISWSDGWKENRYSHELEQLMKQCLRDRYSNFKPNLFVTISLFPPGSWTFGDRSCSINTVYFDNLHKEVINRIDRFFHRSNHHKIPPSEKIPYVWRVETKSQRNRPTEPHIHILLDPTGMQFFEYENNKDKLVASLVGLLEKKQLKSNILIKNCDPNIKDYFFKFPLADVEKLRERNAQNIES